MISSFFLVECSLVGAKLLTFLKQRQKQCELFASSSVYHTFLIGSHLTYRQWLKSADCRNTRVLVKFLTLPQATTPSPENKPEFNYTIVFSVSSVWQ
jgi:hypothetical protein